MNFPPELLQIAGGSVVTLGALTLLWMIIKDPPLLVPYSRFKEVRRERDTLFAAMLEMTRAAKQNAETTTTAVTTLSDVAKMRADAVNAERKDGD